MTMLENVGNAGTIEEEANRISREYERREREVDHDLYAPWSPAEIFMVSERERIAALVLKEIDRFPEAGDRCLEIGYGRLGWLGRMISWGIRDSDLHGIELDPMRAGAARSILPNADLRIGNAVMLPWKSNHFEFVVVSTLFSSILDEQVRTLIATEIDRVLKPGGVVLWYDAAIDNPGNKNLKGINPQGIHRLFPAYRRHVRSLTLAPPILRRVVRLSWPLACLLSSLPFLRTHLLGALIKP